MTTPNITSARILAAGLRTLGLDGSADMMDALADELERLRAQVAPVGWIDIQDRVPPLNARCLILSQEPWEKEPSVKLDRWAEIHEAPVSFSSATVYVGDGWEDDHTGVTHWMLCPPAFHAAPAQQAEPFWHAVVSERAPVINATYRREDVALERLAKIREERPDITDAEVVPLYRAAPSLTVGEWAALVPVETLDAWKSMANSLAVLSLKSERARVAFALKQLIQAEIDDAQPAAQAEPVGRVRIDSGEVHLYPLVRYAEASSLRDGQPIYAGPPSNPPAQGVGEALRAVLSTETARQTFYQLDDGQGIDTDDGRAWLAARAALVQAQKEQQ